MSELEKTDWSKRCTCCGSELTLIRGAYPNTEQRKACAQCCYERLEQIAKIAHPDHGKAYSSKSGGEK